MSTDAPADTVTVAPQRRPHIRLNMIVKNEAHVIERCLASLLPLIDSWVIVDTGSTDTTPALIERALRGKPGQLHHRPWLNFGHNRTEAMQLARQTAGADYILIMDADETLLPAAGFQWGLLDADLYSIVTHSETVEYARNVLVRAALPWRWVGVLHEYLHVDQPFSVGRIEGIHIHRYFDGARGQDPRKYENDARLLEAALSAEPGNTRYAFYLAQSWRDCGQIDKAAAAYAQRATMGGWDEEVWYARYQLAILAEGQQRPRADVVELYLMAFQARPSRAEPLVHLARYLRGQGDYHLAHLFAAHARDIAEPADLLFIEKPCYGWWRDDEYAVACSWTGRHAEARAGFAALLQAPDLPASERERTQANLKFSESRLAAL